MNIDESPKERASWNRVFMIGSLALALIAATTLGIHFSSFLAAAVTFFIALGIQISGRAKAHRMIAKTGTRAFVDYTSAWFIGWVIAAAFGAITIWVLMEIT